MTTQMPQSLIDTIIGSIDIVNHDSFNDDDPDNSGVYFFVEVAIGPQLYTAVLAGESTEHDRVLGWYEQQLSITNNLAALRVALLDVFSEHVDDPDDEGEVAGYFEREATAATTLMDNIYTRMRAVCSQRWDEILAADYAAKND
ncbi:hypothetical protein DBB29_08580 [Pandoraea cepalis]|uniref:Uncharacterized protein n=1 Tax=Pandoraea cepalis TaxID=2508294 RepID=A0AAW7MLG5_9BURK|nr:hypothetical protein [Pandoraea cepalis]MDN4573628.1 hypothetical protein [Pandoraea cepalis]MDN4578170.1 hypothetical protein [Pandoraea cepalis]